MNRIYKVIYSKVRQCYVVVSEIAKSHGRHTKSSVAKSSAALTAGVLIALGSFSFEGMPVAQADESILNNDFIGANDYYWYYDEKTKTWKKYQYKATDIFNNRSRHDLPNYQGAGAKAPGAITAGLSAQAGQQTVTIGDRNAGASRGSVFIGEHSGYDDGASNPAKGGSNNYVTSVGFQSDATGWGSIAIGSNAIAENSKMASDSVTEVGNNNNPSTVRDDTYSIEANPTIDGASVALGYNAHSKDGNIAIGANSEATSTDSDGSYLSVGNENLKRRITNVANGTGNSDVVTLGQMNDAIKNADNLNVNAGWGINVAKENDTTGKVTKNVISLKHNLGTGYNDDEAKGMIIGGLVEDRDSAKQYGAADANSVIVGAGNALASGKSSVVVGGLDNVASGDKSVVVGGDNNNAAGNQSAVFGGRDNTAAGIASTASGGIMNAAVGQQATALGGSNNYVLGTNATAIGGLGKGYDDNNNVIYDSAVRGSSSVGIAGGSTGENAIGALAAGHQAVVTTENGTAIGYQATTDKANTIAFGHDAGDVSGYTIKWKQLPPDQINADGTTNDYTQAPESVTENTYKKAAYNRLVKAADGIDAHDAVVMEQLKPYTKSDASNIGSNLKTYTVGDNGETITEADATADQKKANKDDWGKALGAEPFTTGTSAAATNASTSDQLVTGKTLYDYDKPTGSANYVNANNTTGQNLSALDAQVKANADALSEKTHNIKYYSVNEKNSITKNTLPTVAGLATNSDNLGAKGMGSLASGFSTEADGTLSTVGGSYSGVINEGSVPYLLGVDIRGTAAVSYGTGNINKSTAKSGRTSGVANSLIGQVNDVTNSNAAIAIGAGNTISNSYRDVTIDPIEVLNKRHDPEALRKLMQDAVKESGGQVMVMGGGNTVDKAYMTQVSGVGNTVTGKDSTYAKDTSTQYNFVNGFQNKLTNSKHAYIIGSNNTVSGDSTDDNHSNIVFGDNHKLTNQKNNVIIGSSDTADDETTASDVVAIGHNAKVSAEGGVAIGSGSEATVAGKTTEGYDPATGQNSTKTTADWQATNAAVSIGKANGEVTRQINGVAAGTNDTDAVNVAQLKKLEGMKANVDASNIGSNIKVYKTGDDKTPVLDDEATKQKQTENENAWGAAIGTGKVADPTKSNTNDPTQNGSQQLVTGGEVYNALHGGLTDITVGKAGKDGTDGKDGSIGLNGKNGENGKDGITTTIIKTEKGQPGEKGETGAPGVDGKDITRIVYQNDTNGDGKHTVATLDDGMKYVGDTGKAANVKLDHQLKLSGTTFDEKDENKKYKDTDWTSDNIAVVSSVADETTGDATMYLKLAKDLKNLNSSTYTMTETTGEGDQKKTTTYTTVINGKGLTITSGEQGSTTPTSGPSITIDGINGGGKQITNVGDGITKDKDGNYTISAADKKNAANIGDVQTIVNDAKKDLTEGTNGLNNKANVDASNIGSNIKVYKTGDDKTPLLDDEATKQKQTENENAWGAAIGTGKVADPTKSEKNDPTQNGSQQLVTGGEVYNALHGGLDDVVFGHDGKDGKDGSIGLVGPKGQDGKDGKTTTIIKTETGAAGVNGKDGEDGITRIVYNDKDNPNDKHTVATLDDGMKYAGDTGEAANVKLDHQLKLSGTTFDEKDENKKYKETDWTSGNIAVVSGAADDKTGDATMYLKLAKDLKGLHSSTYTTTGTTGEGDQKQTTDYTTTIDSNGVTIQSKVTKGDKTEVVNGPSMTKDGINGGGKQITNVGNGITTDNDGNYTISDADKTNAANIGDVQTIVNDAKKDLTDGTNGLNNKANVNASNIGSNITVAPIYQKDAEGNDIIQNGQKVVDQKATEDAQKAARTANENAWGTAIGTGEIAKDNGQLVTGKTVYDALHGGLDDVVFGHDGKDGHPGKDGSIGLVGPKGQDGKDGKTTTIIKTETGAAGVNGKDGKDGITRIVYNDKDNPNDKHTVATLDDGMKYVGDTGAVANVKLDHQLKLSGTTFDETDENKKYKDADWTSDNIAVVSNATDETTGDATMYLKLNKNLNLTDKGSVRFGDKNSSTTLDASGLTIKSTVTKEGNTEVVNGPSMTKDGINGGGKQITNVGNGITTDNDGNYTISDADKTNAANIGDVQTIVNDAKKDLTDGTNGLNNKANVNASNIGSNITVAPIYQKDAEGNDIIQNGQKVIDQKATEDAQKAARTANENAWGEAIGTGKIEADNGQLVTGKTVYDEVRPKEDGSYVKKGKSTGENLSALDTQVKSNADAIKKNSESIQNITNNVKNLSDDAVQYDKGSNKTTVTLAGKDGTTITNVKNGALSENSSDAVNGKQLYNEQKAREAADQAITEKVTNNTNEITKIKNGEGFTDTGKTIIKNLSKDAVQVKAGDRIKVDEATDEKTGNKTYTISANNNGTVAKGDGNLISGDTLYKEVHVDKDGSYIKGSQSVGQNLSALDSGLKTTSDLIHTNDKGDTIQIGADSKATKVDISGKDKDGNKTGRVITGVVSDANDPNSAANVGYVNGITSASNEQIYRDMNMQYNHVENDISRAAAGSNALAALHPMQEFDPDDKAQFALGYGHYRNSNAGAVGAFYQPDENSLFSFGVSFGNGDAGLNAGVTFKFGPGGSDHHALTKTQMAKVIDAQSKEIDALKKDNADKDKRIDALEQKVNEILAKVEKDKA